MPVPWTVTTGIPSQNLHESDETLFTRHASTTFYQEQESPHSLHQINHLHRVLKNLNNNLILMLPFFDAGILEL